MAKINFYNIDNAEKADIFTEIATHLGMTPFAVEKDWWVSRTLEIIFQMPIAEHLVFKGGTSLSKAWKLINRFSEDIDLAIDKTFFGFAGALGKNQRDKLRKMAGAYTTGTFFEELKEVFGAKSSELNSTLVAQPVLEKIVTPLCIPVLQIFLMSKKQGISENSKFVIIMLGTVFNLFRCGDLLFARQLNLSLLQ